MQNRYVGDIGDFGKYGLLRALCHGRRLGVAWYLYPDEAHNGGIVQYLCEPDEWRSVDPEAEYKHREDLLDVALCAWTASVWVQWGKERCQVLGCDDSLLRNGLRATIMAPCKDEQRQAGRSEDRRNRSRKGA